jgi:hypothetical protein
MNSVGSKVTSSVMRPMMASGESILCELTDRTTWSEGGELSDVKPFAKIHYTCAISMYVYI